MQVGVAFNEIVDSFAAGEKVARDALDNGKLESCDLVLMFTTSRHDAGAFRDGVRSVVGAEAQVVGGWSVGGITNDHLGYGGNQVVLAAFKLNTVKCDVFSHGSLAEGEVAVGRSIGRSLNELSDDLPAVLLLYDMVNRTTGRMTLNMATPLLKGIQDEMGELPNLVGAGLCGDMMGTPTVQWVDDELREQQALALAFTGGVRMDTSVMHGCDPLSGYMTVTKAEGAKLLELDGRPAIDVISDLLAGSDITPDDFGYFVTLGMNMGDKWGEYDETAYANRLCLRADKKTGGLLMFESDLVPGVDVQLMRRSVRMDYIAPRVEKAFDMLDGRKPVFALYIDCAGRAAAHAGMDEEDAAEVQRAVAGRVPMMGVYSGVEIGKVAGIPYPLDWTGVFCLFSV